MCVCECINKIINVGKKEKYKQTIARKTENILLLSRLRNDALISVEIYDSPQGAHFSIHSPPVMVAPVVPRPQQILPSPVAGQLIEDPGALQHIERVNLIEVEAVLKRGAVLSDLYHLASVIFPLIKSDPVRASLAHPEVERGEKQTMK